MTDPTRHLDAELSAYLDDGLDAAAREAVEGHVRDCADCAALLDELRAVAAGARALEDHPPEADLWPGIARRIGALPAAVVPLAPRARAFSRRLSLTLPQLAAAAVIVALVSGGTVWWALRRPSPAGPGGAPGGPGTTSVPALNAGTVAQGSDTGATESEDISSTDIDASTAAFEIRRYDQAVADLERVLAQNRSRLDPETIRTVEANLRVIDGAIEQARRALTADPANPYLSGHLAEQMKRKVRVLQRATDAVAANFGG